MNPGCKSNSVRNMLKSPGAAQATTTLPTFWDMKAKSEQQMGAEKLSRPKMLGDGFQQKYNQLFWGLPSLHSESLMMAAWIHQSPSSLQPSFFLFNGNLNVYPIPMQEESSSLSQTHMSYLKPQSPASILSLPQFPHPHPCHIWSQPYLRSLPILMPSPLPQAEDFEPSCSSSQSRSLSLPGDIHGPHRGKN